MRERSIVGCAALTLMMAVGLPRAGAARADSLSPRIATGTFLAGLQNGYLYRSAGGTYDWQESDNGLPPGTDITALAASPDGATIFAGTGGSGMYSSTDGGNNWRDDNGGDDNLENSQITGITVNPLHSQYVYAITADDSFYSSSDAGADWHNAYLPTGGTTTSLAVDQRNPAVLLVGTQGGGIVRSPDGGDNWYAGDLSTDVNVQAISFNPRSASVAYAATDSGIYQSIDSGYSWQLDQRGIPDGTSFQSIAVDPSNPARVIAATAFGDFYRSQDGGTSWSFRGQADGNQINAILFDPTHYGVVLAGSSLGTALYRSENGGVSWSRYYTGLDASNGIMALAWLGRGVLPTDAVPAPYRNSGDIRYFPETHHTVSGPFLTFYNANNGLKIFGLPLSETFVEGGQTVQYFERSRLVYAHGRIAVSALGLQLTAGRYFQRVACCPRSGDLWFSQTGHTIAGKFLTFWRGHNGLQLFGYPISQPLYERNDDGTGRTYMVQYFQNARMEYHPELGGTGNVVTLGLLGKEALHQLGWI